MKTQNQEDPIEKEREWNEVFKKQETKNQSQENHKVSNDSIHDAPDALRGETPTLSSQIKEHEFYIDDGMCSFGDGTYYKEEDVKNFLRQVMEDIDKLKEDYSGVAFVLMLPDLKEILKKRAGDELI